MDDLIDGLKKVLGSTFVLYFKTHAFHVNVESMFFESLHALFGEQYGEMFEQVDEIAERIRQMDAYAPSTLGRLLELSIIEEQPKILAPTAMVLELVEDHEKMLDLLKEVFHLAEDSDAQGIANYVAERIEAHSKHRWKLRATAKRISEK